MKMCASMRDRQIIKQYIEGDIEQIPPARHQLIKNRRLVLEQSVVTLILGQAVDTEPQGTRWVEFMNVC
jgi:hypothetical protein